MAYDEELAFRLRKILEPFGDKITEKRMFGGLCYMYNGKMSVGIVKNNLCVRVLPTKYEKTLKRSYVYPMDFTGKPMREFVYVSPEGFETEATLNEWVELGIEHAQSKMGK